MVQEGREAEGRDFRLPDSAGHVQVHNEGADRVGRIGQEAYEEDERENSADSCRDVESGVPVLG